MKRYKIDYQKIDRIEYDSYFTKNTDNNLVKIKDSKRRLKYLKKEIADTEKILKNIGEVDCKFRRLLVKRRRNLSCKEKSTPTSISGW